MAEGGDENDADDGTSVNLAGEPGGISNTMKFVSIVASMVAGAASLIIGVFFFVSMSRQPPSKPLNSSVLYKIDDDYGNDHEKNVATATGKKRKIERRLSNDRTSHPVIESQSTQSKNFSSDGYDDDE